MVRVVPLLYGADALASAVRASRGRAAAVCAAALQGAVLVDVDLVRFHGGRCLCFDFVLLLA